MSASIYAKLNEVFADVFDEEVKLAADTQASDVEGWDSLHHVQLIMAIERAFKARFTTSEIASLKNVGSIVQLLEQKSPF